MRGHQSAKKTSWRNVLSDRSPRVTSSLADYLWICLWFYQGKFVYPSSSGDIKPFLSRMGNHIYEVGPLCARLCAACLSSDLTRCVLPRSGRIPDRVCVADVRRANGLPARPCLCHAREGPEGCVWCWKNGTRARSLGPPPSLSLVPDTRPPTRGPQASPSPRLATRPSSTTATPSPAST